MTGTIYQVLALRTVSDKEQGNLLINGALGLSGESGEVADMIKKWKFQGHLLDYAKLAEEIGDVMWYCAIMSEAIGFTLDDIMQMNITKLEERYPKGFETKRSINR